MGFEIRNENGEGVIPDWYQYTMILLTGSVIMGVLGFAVIHMFAMLFIVIALGGLAAFLMALSWKPGWIRYESIDPEKWKYGSKSNPFGGERGVFEGYEKLKP